MGRRKMTVPLETAVIPVWFIQKWLKENAEEKSALEFWINQMLKEWELEEFRHANKSSKSLS